jgi:FKBP-type peptidyl-prolyl cis-trans isomerase
VPLAGCGGDTSSPDRTTDPSARVERRTTPKLSAAAQARKDARDERRRLLALERSFAPNPWREPGASRPHPHGKVTRVIVREIERGRGPALQGTENVYANFVKTYWKSGRKFLTAWGPGRFEYLSLSSQAPAITRGMTGMRPGGRRVIAMPRTISEVHEPNGGAGFVDARIDVVLRQIIAE